MKIKELRRKKGITQEKLGVEIGVSGAAVSDYERGKSQPDLEKLLSLARIFEVSVEELIGESPMITNDEPGVYVQGNIRSVKNNISELYTQIPFISVRAQAGVSKITHEYCDLRWVEETYPVFLPITVINQDSVAIEIEGDSMEPTIRDRAIVLANNIHGNDWQYESGGVYAVLFGPGKFVVKRIRTNDMRSEGQLRLHSDNDLHGTITVPANEIHCMWKVVSKIYEPVR
ncbi:helix-turn-helix domain-containing protein [Rudanella paleaurantiibacter]|uniref:Helix-turn-helix domain-containing protein n=1 Tax=Rudanella paleaurantiibacter TaxID=2614655 RepID=A0A7J5TVI1_9BACT|nr:LexA family transcriptional regulator [Rudanella paleaurantiibacter]KAB7728159.1 helix-turn-helix domain-containing protein [Rudanella paleaurantiibacter]